MKKMVKALKIILLCFCIGVDVLMISAMSTDNDDLVDLLSNEARDRYYRQKKENNKILRVIIILTTMAGGMLANDIFNKKDKKNGKEDDDGKKR